MSGSDNFEKKTKNLDFTLSRKCLPVATRIDPVLLVPVPFGRVPDRRLAATTVHQRPSGGGRSRVTIDLFFSGSVFSSV
jgi:hypothetical protein